MSSLRCSLCVVAPPRRCPQRERKSKQPEDFGLGDGVTASRRGHVAGGLQQRRSQGLVSDVDVQGIRPVDDSASDTADAKGQVGIAIVGADQGAPLIEHAAGFTAAHVVGLRQPQRRVVEGVWLAADDVALEAQATVVLDLGAEAFGKRRAKR